MSISKSFFAFSKEAPDHNRAWMEAVQKLDEVCALDKKTEHLSYIAVMAAMRLVGGISFHVQMAKKVGATREEVISAILIGLPAAGNVVTESLSVALEAYDQ
ncbi:carboxymuconolactone decarboxylase family protein [Clostridium botulinum]|uniref:Carboxymuconolactone decarboxylase family protein n=1 Tax=Clostridium botulinum TaxID=1491 RepID=A0A6M0SQB4_CLOBO|nr:carboxymuconolactone decarboxylase family protein [Clostridium botulinum]